MKRWKGIKVDWWMEKKQIISVGLFAFHRITSCYCHGFTIAVIKDERNINKTLCYAWENIINLIQKPPTFHGEVKLSCFQKFSSLISSLESDQSSAIYKEKHSKLDQGWIRTKLVVKLLMMRMVLQPTQHQHSFAAKNVRIRFMGSFENCRHNFN